MGSFDRCQILGSKDACVSACVSAEVLADAG